MNKKRVVVTGLGVISSVGIGKDEFWNSIINGKSGISKVETFDTSGFRCHYGGEIKNFNPEEFIPKKQTKLLGRTSQLALSATRLALKDANITPRNIKQNAGIFLGTTMGEKPLEEVIDVWVTKGKASVDKIKLLYSSANNISGCIGIYFKINGPNYLIPTACAAGNYCIGYGFDLISKGKLDFAITGGVDTFSKVAFSGFQRLYAMAPEKCQPFDKNRKGMLLGEGAGILFLESLDSALRRNANIYAEILGYGLSCDSYHITAPRTEGIVKAMQKALKVANIKEGDVDYINSHGTGTAHNDKTECAAIKSLFKEHAKNIPVTSLKSMLGHAMGAASSIESIAACLTIRNSIIPPTINYETPDPDCDINCVPNKAIKAKVNIVLKNAFAFGGNNCCVVFKKY